MEEWEKEACIDTMVLKKEDCMDMKEWDGHWSINRRLHR